MQSLAKFTLIFIILFNYCDFSTEIKKDKTMENEKQSQNIILSAEIENAEDSLSITYNLTNKSDDIIYIFDLMPLNNKIDENLAYRCFEEPNTLRVVRAALPLPLDRDVFMKETPYARSIDPNSSIDGKIVLPKPIMEYNPYYPLMNQEEQIETEIIQVKLIIGWIEKRSSMKINETKIDGKDAVKLSGSWQKPFYRLAKTTVQTKTNLLVREEAFDRRMPEE